MTNRTPSTLRQIVVGVVLLLVVVAIAGFGSLASTSHVDGWYADAQKVPWNPPDAVFGPAWSVLYLMIAIAGFLLWRAGRTTDREPDRGRRTLVLYVVQLALNAMWTPAFFAGYPVLGEAAWWIAMAVISALIVSVVWLIGRAWKLSKPAALLLVPYVLWLIYAATLNAGIIALN